MTLTKYLFAFIFLSLYATVVNAQIEISGTIVDCESQTIPGATIFCKKAKVGTVSDINGFYKISVPDSNAVLIYSSVGYTSKKLRVGKETVLNIVLLIDKKNTITPVMAGKPVIYLYPPTEMDIALQFQYNGTVLTTYPEYKSGWNVHAYPNGTLTNKIDNKEYSYLFWEGKKTYTDEELHYSNGFIVAGDSALSFLQTILPKLGLKPHEYNEFIVFWLPFLQANGLNFVYFRTGNECNIISKNIVQPTPNTEIRVFMEFKKIDSPFKVAPQIFTTPIRNGFTLVEWGGSLLKQVISVRDENGKYITR